MRAPLVVRSVIDGRRYVTALVLMLLGGTIFALGVSGVWGLPPLIWGASIFLALFGPVSAANTFLGYPRLTATGDLLIIEDSPFTIRRVDLTPFGPAYVAFYPKGRGYATELIFRTVEEEARHRAAEPHPHAPEHAEAQEKISIMNFVGHDVAKGEALANEINAQRGL
jgi:hypothetical protein